MTLHLTHVGTATVILELAGLRIVTDPVLGGPCDCNFGWGMRSRHQRGPHLEPTAIGAADLVLLSHDQHEDNLDTAGRALLAHAPCVLTTRAAARRLGGGNARGADRGGLGSRVVGLLPFESHAVAAPAGGDITITAVPARHGPPLSLPFVGPVVGFVLSWDGLRNGAVYISGDTVYFSGLEEIARRFRIGTAILHLGGASNGLMRFTMDAREGARAAHRLGARTVVPVHYADWTHFRDPPERIVPTFAAAGLTDRLRMLTPGVRCALDA
jgi:L-ascorbate metabolism protein UlaG (beta-lactamase superfamily)